MSSVKIIVVLPAFNEEAVIADVVRDVLSRYDCLVVDDGSADATAQRARSAGAIVARHPINRGQGAALQTGMELALRRGADCVVTFDADGQHRIEDVARLVEPVVAGSADVVLGSRFLDDSGHIPSARRWLLRAATLFTRFSSGLPVTDAHNGLRVFSRRAAERIEIHMDRMAHASELIDQVRRSGLPWREMAVTVRYTDYSQAKGQRATGAIQILFDYLLGRLLG